MGGAGIRLPICELGKGGGEREGKGGPGLKPGRGATNSLHASGRNDPMDFLIFLQSVIVDRSRRRF